MRSRSVKYDRQLDVSVITNSSFYDKIKFYPDEQVLTVNAEIVEHYLSLLVIASVKRAFIVIKPVCSPILTYVLHGSNVYYLLFDDEIEVVEKALRLPPHRYYFTYDVYKGDDLRREFPRIKDPAVLSDDEADEDDFVEEIYNDAPNVCFDAYLSSLWLSLNLSARYQEPDKAVESVQTYQAAYIAPTVASTVQAQYQWPNGMVGVVPSQQMYYQAYPQYFYANWCQYPNGYPCYAVDPRMCGLPLNQSAWNLYYQQWLQWSQTQNWQGYYQQVQQVNMVAQAAQNEQPYYVQYYAYYTQYASAEQKVQHYVPPAARSSATIAGNAVYSAYSATVQPDYEPHAQNRYERQNRHETTTNRYRMRDTAPDLYCDEFDKIVRKFMDEHGVIKVLVTYFDSFRYYSDVFECLEGALCARLEYNGSFYYVAEFRGYKDRMLLMQLLKRKPFNIVSISKARE